MKAVCVYCGSSGGNDPVYKREATKLGGLIYEKRWSLVYGGGTAGLMGSVARAAVGDDNAGRVHGVIPDALVAKERERATAGSTTTTEEHGSNKDVVGEDPVDGTTGISQFGETTVVPDMHTRKRLMASMSDAFVALPGGFGTLEEILECITWSQLGIHGKPVVLLNINGYFDALLQFFQNAIESGFISKSNGQILQVASTPEEVIDLIINYKVPEGRFNLKWSDEGL
ncbi:Uncharacterized protein RNJ44_04642 [Nakaseomyces bracarensis]|uniref:Uncharacterized protein n=1 Tax=Nakaseomyces bracarensis TaxID=273131 RepID=A0ABR4NVW4_9SACH